MRRARLELSGVPLHTTHRGVNRAATFLDDEDCAAYLQALAFASSEHDVQIHAYVLMSNHVHLLVGTTQAGTVSRMMQSVGRRHVRGVQRSPRTHGHAVGGALQSRFVDSDGHLLACLRYIELNPVRAVALP